VVERVATKKKRIGLRSDGVETPKKRLRERHPGRLDRPKALRQEIFPGRDSIEDASRSVFFGSNRRAGEVRDVLSKATLG
jgi:hypothetical protein